MALAEEAMGGVGDPIQAYCDLLEVRWLLSEQAGYDVGEVPAGDYAVTVWHDDNANRQFDVNPRTGAPADGWATANADGLRSRPTFDQVRLSIPATGAHIPLALHYGR